MHSTQDIDKLLADLYRRGIRITAEAGRLKCSGPQEVFDSEVNAALKHRKAEILAYFGKQSTAHNGVQSSAASHSIQAVTEIPDHLPLSFAQQRLWFLEQMQPGSAAYNLPLAIEVTGQLNTSAFGTALQAIVDRHDVLRTTFVANDGEPEQRIAAVAKLEIDIIDLRSNGQQTNSQQNNTKAAETAHHAALAAATKPFDLTTDLPLRVALYRTGDKSWLMLFTVHHIAADAWSLDILLREFSALYPSILIGQQAQLSELPIQYADFALWQRSDEQAKTLQAELTYWQDQLSGELPRMALPTDHPRPRTQTFNGDVVEFSVAQTTAERLRALGQTHGASLFMTLLSAFNILLYRYSGQRDLLIGTPVANRNRVEVEDLLGLFVNSLVIRTKINPAMDFTSLLAQVRSTTLTAYDHQDLPFEHLVETLAPERDPSISPLFQVKFRLENAAAQQIELPGLSLRTLPQQITMAKLDLSVDMYETEDGLVGGFEYNSDLFERKTMQRMAAQFSALIDRIAEQPQTPLADISVLTDAERQLQQYEWNYSAKPYQQTSCYHHLFEACAERYPDAIAVVFDGAQRIELSYSELNRRANQLAHYLLKQDAGAEQVIAICLQRSVEMVVALLATLKAGAAYLPLDANYPADRLAYMLQDANVRILIASSELTLPETKKRLNLDITDLNDYPENNPSLDISADNLAYLIYTSGSTGRPKGVLVPHRGLVNLTEDKIRKCDVRPGDCVLQFFSFSFDGSVPEFVMTLAVGARLLMAPSTTLLPGAELRELMLRNRVSHITITPSALNALLHADYPDLRLVLTGGEAPPPELIQHWSKHRHYINAYGPTETTVNASMVFCGNGAPLQPTILPSANKQLYVLDEDLQILPVGAIGELHIGGVGITRGYLNQPGLTAERFIPNPFTSTDELYPAPVLYKSGDLASYRPDGRIRILGRIDQQTKIRGFRIELSEIERVLEQHPQVKVGLVIVREYGDDKRDDKRLLAYAVANTDAPDSSDDVRRFIADKLPQFMLPSGFSWLPELPLTNNGKLDFDALPEPVTSQGKHIAPRNDMEVLLAGLFAEILPLESISIEDNFFDLGGHSLLATRLVARLMERTSVSITIMDLFHSPTIAGLAQRIEHKQHLDKLTEVIEDENEEREEITL